MADEDFDPKKFIDREFEQKLFEELLQLSANARILAIQDEKGGMGKSQLLERFKYRCRTVKPRTPVSLVKLDQLPGESPMDLVNILVKDLSSFIHVDFPTFNQCESARLSKDFRSIRAAFELQRATFDKIKRLSFAGAATIDTHSDIEVIHPRPSTMMTRKLFLASSSDLIEDRKDFEILINRKNKALVDRGVFIRLEVWEDFLDAVSKTRLQDEYNKVIQECDIFVMLFSTKVGQYTEEEFETAFKQFRDTNKPVIFTYFKDVQICIGSVNRAAMNSLWSFQQKLTKLGHFWTSYKNTEDLVGRFSTQLEKLDLQGSIVNVSLREFTTEQDLKAKDLCLRAFFDDMKELCAKQLIIIMLDAYEKCPRYIKDWVEEQLLEHLFFNFADRPERLILVIAGRTTPDFERRWSADDYSTTVRSVRALGKWTKKHVGECLRVFGFDYKPEDLDSFYRLVEIGVPPSQVVQMIKTLL